MVKNSPTSRLHEGHGSAGQRVTEAPSCAVYQRRKRGRLLPPLLSFDRFILRPHRFILRLLLPLRAHLGGLLRAAFVPGLCSRHESRHFEKSSILGLLRQLVKAFESL